MSVKPELMVSMLIPFASATSTFWGMVTVIASSQSADLAHFLNVHLLPLSFKLLFQPQHKGGPLLSNAKRKTVKHAKHVIGRVRGG